MSGDRVSRSARSDRVASRTTEPIRHVTASGLTLVGQRWGVDGEGPLVLLLHGGGQTRHSWARTADRLTASGLTAIALDARGHGDSDWASDADYSLDAFMSDLRSFVATLDAPPVLVGASLGGIAALFAAGEDPGLARAVVLVDVVVSVEPEGVHRIRDFMTAYREGFGSLEEVGEAVAAYNPVRQRPRNLDGLRKNVRRGTDGRWYWHCDPEFMRIDDEPQRRIDSDRLRAAASQLSGDDNDLFAGSVIAFIERLGG